MDDLVPMRRAARLQRRACHEAAQRAVDRVPLYRPRYCVRAFKQEAGDVVGMFLARARRRMVEQMEQRVATPMAPAVSRNTGRDSGARDTKAPA